MTKIIRMNDNYDDFNDPSHLKTAHVIEVPTQHQASYAYLVIAGREGAVSPQGAPCPIRVGYSESNDGYDCDDAILDGFDVI